MIDSHSFVRDGGFIGSKKLILPLSILLSLVFVDLLIEKQETKNTINNNKIIFFKLTPDIQPWQNEVSRQTFAIYFLVRYILNIYHILLL